MKYNLKNRPKKFNAGSFDVALPPEINDWFKGFEKELRQILDVYAPMENIGAYSRGKAQLIREILGETNNEG